MSSRGLNIRFQLDFIRYYLFYSEKYSPKINIFPNKNPFYLLTITSIITAFNFSVNFKHRFYGNKRLNCSGIGD